MTTLTIAVITLISLYMIIGIVRVETSIKDKKKEAMLESKGLFKIEDKYYYKGRYFEVRDGKVYYKDNKGIKSLMLGEGHIDLVISLIDFEEEDLIRNISRNKNKRKAI
jgi:hypothetical protein